MRVGCAVVRDQGQLIVVGSLSSKQRKINMSMTGSRPIDKSMSKIVIKTMITKIKNA